MTDYFATRMLRSQTGVTDVVDESLMGKVSIDQLLGDEPVVSTQAEHAYQGQLDRTAKEEIRATLTSLRGDHLVPRTVLHCLLLDDWQSCSRLAARINMDPMEVEPILFACRHAGLIEEQDFDGVPRYSIAWASRLNWPEV